MKFKHAFHVFVDNFSVVYKQMLYRLVIMTVAGLICTFGVYPFIKGLINSPQFNSLIDGIKGFISNLLNGQVGELSDISIRVQQAYAEFMELLQTNMTQIIVAVLLLLLVYFVSRWFWGLGNYAAACLINDKMALRAKQHFLSTLIRNLKESATYNAIYVPLSVLFDLAISVGMFFLLFFLLNHVLYFVVSIFLFALILVLAIALKMTFTTDWLPALIRGKKGQLGSIRYTFSRKNKHTINIFSNFVVITILIMALNVAAALFTFGVGLLLTVPSSYVIIICFEFVNYYDREEIKYFTDKNTVIKPEKERPLSREEFFRGDQ